MGGREICCKKTGTGAHEDYRRACRFKRGQAAPPETPFLETELSLPAGYRAGDVAFVARADSRDGLFEACAKALTDVMVDRRSIRPRVDREIRLDADDTDGLLYDFLTELIVIKDVDSLLFKEFVPRVSRDGTQVNCTMRGESIDRERHKLRNDVKAVTMHMFGVKNTGPSVWESTIVLDI